MNDKIVLFAKQPGKTSFSSLFTIKHAFNTQKVGHTGTLDSFASGLLVVCCGSLTRLASRITEFDKTYEAVIAFGSETDTLEYTGQVVKTASLPTKEAFLEALKQFSGKLMQTPPSFSAIHINGKRASDIARSGNVAEIPPRQIEVYSSEVLELQTKDNLVQYAKVRFSVSKGTYIRSLARDLGYACGSCAHLVGLLRTKVGSFLLKDAAGFSLLPDFYIKNCIKDAENYSQNNENKISKEAELELRKQVVNTAVNMNPEIASLCGFGTLILNDDKIAWFRNGGKLSSSMFNVSPFTINEEYAAVFTQNGAFAGLLQKDSNGYFKYSFVVS